MLGTFWAKNGQMLVTQMLAHLRGQHWGGVKCWPYAQHLVPNALALGTKC